MGLATPHEQQVAADIPVDEEFGHSSSSRSPSHQRMAGMKTSTATTVNATHMIGFCKACRSSSPQMPMATACAPKRRPRHHNPAMMNCRRSISPIPATHASTLYGMGEIAAMNIPAVPYRTIKLSNLTMCFLAINRSATLLPNALPSHHPSNAPATLVNVTTDQMRKRAQGSPCASMNIGNVSASGGMGWMNASVNDKIPRPGKPRSRDHCT